MADDKSSIITQAVGFNTQVINVFGFGNGNKIGFNFTIKSGNGGQAYSYDSDSGVLSLSSGLFGQNLILVLVMILNCLVLSLIIVKVSHQ